jgi:hypothetical protein
MAFRTGSVSGKLAFTCPLNCGDAPDSAGREQSATELAQNSDAAAAEVMRTWSPQVGPMSIQLAAHAPAHVPKNAPLTMQLKAAIRRPVIIVDYVVAG